MQVIDVRIRDSFAHAGSVCRNSEIGLPRNARSLTDADRCRVGAVAQGRCPVLLSPSLSLLVLAGLSRP
jgi:hypothetical protein